MIMALHHYFRFNVHGLLVIASGFSALAVGLIVFARNPRDLAHRAFLMTTGAAFSGRWDAA